jgi:dolichyl-phosphate-mannose--protein O-mannosyl transferase
LIWWGILLALSFAAAHALAGEARRQFRPYAWAALVLAVAYVFNFLPFATIPRVMFQYHYFFAFIYSLAFATLAVGILAGWMDPKTKFWHFPSTFSRNLYIGILLVAVAGFLYFLPLSYGLPMTPNQLQGHMWLHTWR